ncbi:MAG: serine/threonine protein kinase [Candidatus Obscuribacterales bacterium]|nr:serine/threonine protein kinase [Candidatus Obscuribacterales bacterium]
MADKQNNLPSEASDQPQTSESLYAKKNETTGAERLEQVNPLGSPQPLDESDHAYSLNVPNLTLRSKLGTGAHGSVYVAEHHILKKFVAVKILHSEYGEANWDARFQREAQAMSRLSHPNIARIFSYSISADGRAVLVMELVNGRSLENSVNENGRFSAADAVRFFLPVLDAMQYAHDCGVIHRDIKPGNIMIDADGEPRVLDFGVAKLATADSAKQRLTTTGQIIGTPAYMSPEQCKGQEVDSRSDVYSLGCVLFFMLTGKSVFAGNDAEVLMAQVSQQAKVDSDGLSDDLVHTLQRALSKDPKMRFQNCKEFSESLLSANLTNASSRSGRQRVVLGFALSIIAVLVAALIWGFSHQDAKTPIGVSALLTPLNHDKEFEAQSDSIRIRIQRNDLEEAEKQLRRWTANPDGLSVENRIKALSGLMEIDEKKNHHTAALKHAGELSDMLRSPDLKATIGTHPDRFILTAVTLSNIYRANKRFDSAARELKLAKDLLEKAERVKAEKKKFYLDCHKWYFEALIKLADAQDKSGVKLRVMDEAAKYFAENQDVGPYTDFASQQIEMLIEMNRISDAKSVFRNFVKRTLNFSNSRKSFLFDSLHSITGALVRADKPAEASEWFEYARAEIESKAALSEEDRLGLHLAMLTSRALIGASEASKFSNSELRQLEPYVFELLKTAVEQSPERKHARKAEDYILFAQQLTWFLALRDDQDAPAFLSRTLELLKRHDALTPRIIGDHAWLLKDTKIKCSQAQVLKMKDQFIEALKKEYNNQNAPTQLTNPTPYIAGTDWFIRCQTPGYAKSDKERQFFFQCWKIVSRRKDVSASHKIQLLHFLLESGRSSPITKSTVDRYSSDLISILRKEGAYRSSEKRIDFDAKTFEDFVNLIQFLYILQDEINSKEECFKFIDAVVQTFVDQKYYGQPRLELPVLHLWFAALSKQAPNPSYLKKLDRYTSDLLGVQRNWVDTKASLLAQTAAYCSICLHRYGQDRKGLEIISDVYRRHHSWSDGNLGLHAFLLTAKALCSETTSREKKLELASDYLSLLKDAEPGSDLVNRDHHTRTIRAIVELFVKENDALGATRFLSEVEKISTNKNIAPEVLVPFCKSQQGALSKR